MSGDRGGNQPQLRYDPLVALDYIDTYQRTHANRSPSLWRMSRDLNITTRLIIYGLLHELARADLLRIVTHGRAQPADPVITETGRQRLREWRVIQGRSAGPRSEDER